MTNGNAESGKLVIGNTEIPYSVVRSSRRKKTITLTLEADTGIVIFAPTDVDFSTIEKLARKRSDWIIKKLADLKQCLQVYQAREFVSGESLSYLGRQYRLQVLEKTEDAPSCKLKGRWVVVTVPAGLSKRQKTSMISTLLEQWYKQLAQEKLHQRTELWAKRLEIDYSQLLLSNPKKRWGSCDSQNNIRLNWRIIMAPISLVDYVIVHELCHVLYKNHSEDFWRLLGSVMPDYELRKASLKMLGAGYRL